MGNMKMLYKKSLRLEAAADAAATVAPAERVKQRMAEAKIQQTKSLLDTINSFLEKAGEKSAIDLVESARHVADLIPPVAEMYDSPDEVDIRITLADLYVWLQSLSSAPSERIQEAIDIVKDLYDELAVGFSSGSEG